MCKSVLNVLESILVQTKYTESIYTVHVDNRSSKIQGGGVVNKLTTTPVLLSDNFGSYLRFGKEKFKYFIQYSPTKEGKQSLKVAMTMQLS